MRIGILVSMINNFGEKGFYNSQEIGLAKSLAKIGHTVVVYKLLKRGTVLPENFRLNGLEVNYYSVRSIGINGLVETRILNPDLNSLVFFSDTQLSVPGVWKWCKKNNVKFIPYIGAIESHSPNRFKAKLMNFLFQRNLSVFKRSICLAKNTDVVEKLKRIGVKKIKFAPVGIDLDLLNSEYKSSDILELKREYEFQPTDKIILFIGRLDEEKRPIDLINIFNELYNYDENYRLLIVGKGSLYQKVMDQIKNLNLTEVIRYIDKIANDKIWKLYRISEAFVNLNKQEIFGMVLMEAMFYETRLVAFHAPGPDYIIEDGISGELVDNDKEMIETLKKPFSKPGSQAHQRVVEHLTWDTTAKIIEAIASEFSRTG